MPKPTLPRANRSQTSSTAERKMTFSTRRRRSRRMGENSDVLISAVISPYLLTHLHHVLQRAEHGANQEGRTTKAANFAQLRKVLCMDARSMKDASATGMHEGDSEQLHDSKIESKVA